MIWNDVYFQPEAQDPVLDPAHVLEVARRHAPQVSSVLQVDESGGEARSYLLDGEIVLKTQRPHRLRPRTNLAKESFILTELARISELPVPRVIGYGKEGQLEYILMTRMPGVALEHITLEGEARVQVLRRLGELLWSLHHLDQGRFLTTDLISGDRDAADLRARLIAALDRLDTAMPATAEWPSDLAPAALGATLVPPLAEDVPLVVLHSNPGPEHVFVDPRSGHFTGVIDFGDAYRSHPALDLRPWRDREDAEALLDGYRSAGPLPPGFETVRRAALVITEIGLVARGRTDPRTGAKRVRSLI